MLLHIYLEDPLLALKQIRIISVTYPLPRPHPNIYNMYIKKKKKINGLEKNNSLKGSPNSVSSACGPGEVLTYTGKRPGGHPRGDWSTSGTAVGLASLLVSVVRGALPRGCLLHELWSNDLPICFYETDLGTVWSWDMSQNHTSGQRRQQKVSCSQKVSGGSSALSKSLSLGPRSPS